jgi:hypothetical protein
VLVYVVAVVWVRDAVCVLGMSEGGGRELGGEKGGYVDHGVGRGVGGVFA